MCVAKSGKSNRRDFYLVLESLGPTGSGSNMNSSDTVWASNLTWGQDYLAVSTSWNTPLKAIQEARDILNWSVYLTSPGSPTRQKRREKQRHQPIPNFTETIENLVSAGIEMDNINWEYICEDDSAGTGYAIDLLTQARNSGYSNGHTKLSTSAALSGLEGYLSEALNNTLNFVTRDATLFARGGFSSVAHSIVNYANVILVERTNDDVGSLAPAIAFLRGAVEQYNTQYYSNTQERKKRGIDLSMWWGVINGCVNPFPATLHRRALWNTYFAGSSIITVEGCGYIDPTSKQPYPISEEIDSLGKFLKQVVSPKDRGVHDSVVAVVLPTDNGWNERPSWGRGGQGTSIWNYANIPWYNQLGSGAVDGLFSHIYPGVGGTVGFRAFPFGQFQDNLNPRPSPFARSSIANPYAPNPDDIWTASSSIPFGKFHDRNEARAWFEKNPNADPSEFRPMADTRYGDIFDVFVAKMGGKLKIPNDKYKIVIWLSSNDSMDDGVLNELTSYVTNGGTLIIPVGSLNAASAASFSGISVNGNVRVGRAFQFIGDSSHTTEVFDFVDLDDVNENEVVVHSIPEQSPVVVRRQVGKGHIYTCLVPWFENGSGDLSILSKELLDRLMKQHQPVQISTGINAGLFWTSSVMDTSSKKFTRYISISNNGGSEWNGTMVASIPPLKICQQWTCKDLRGSAKLTTCKYAYDTNMSLNVNGKKTESSSFIEFGISVQKYDATVVRIVCNM